MSKRNFDGIERFYSKRRAEFLNELAAGLENGEGFVLQLIN